MVQEAGTTSSFTDGGSTAADQWNSKLPSYGVSLSIDASLGATEAQETLLVDNTYQVVLAYANKLAEIAPGNSPTTIFQQVFGTTDIDIQDTWNIGTESDKYGENNGIQNGSYNIELAGQSILNGGMTVSTIPLTFEQLMAHELAHNLTWQGYIFNNELDIEGVELELWSYPRIGFGVMAGHYDPYNSPIEITADAVASWVLDDFRIDGDGYDYFNENAITRFELVLSQDEYDG